MTNELCWNDDQPTFAPRRSGKDRRRNRGGGGEDASCQGERRGDGGVRPSGGGNRRCRRRRDGCDRSVKLRRRQIQRIRRRPARPLAPPRDASKEGRRVGDVHEDQGTGRGGADGPGGRQVSARGGNRSKPMATRRTSRCPNGSLLPRVWKYLEEVLELHLPWSRGEGPCAGRCTAPSAGRRWR